MVRLFNKSKDTIDDIYTYIYCRKYPCYIGSIKKSMFISYKDIYKKLGKEKELLTKLNNASGVIKIKSCKKQELEKIFDICTNNIIKIIVDKMVDINEYDSNGYTILNYMIEKSNFEIIKYIVDNRSSLGLNMDYEMEDNKWGYLHFACKYISDANTIKCIIDAGINIESVTTENVKPITLAIRYMRNDIIEYLLDKNVDLEVETELKWKPIHYLLKYNRSVNIHRKLLDHNVNIECQISGGWYPVHFLCRYSTKEIAQLYIDMEISLETTDFFGWTPFHYLCKHTKDEKFIELFISENIDIHKEDYNGYQPIHIACQYSTIEIIKQLVQNGCDVYAETRNKKMAIDILYTRFSNEEIKTILSIKN